MSPIEDIVALQMGVRVDKEGSILRDFHTAMHVLRAKGGIKETEPSNRYYLADAAFLVGLHGDETLLQQIHTALANPLLDAFPRAQGLHPFTAPLSVGRSQNQPISRILEAVPLDRGQQVSNTVPWRTGDARLRLILDEGVTNDVPDTALTAVYQDHPLSFAKGKRHFASRRVKIISTSLPTFREPFSPKEKETV